MAVLKVKVNNEWLEIPSFVVPNGFDRITSLDQSVFAKGNVIDVVGTPVYVDDVDDYSSYSITETGWYIFVRVMAMPGIEVSAETEIEGADGSIAETDEDHVDLALKFDVAAMIKTVTITWETGTSETFHFRANDLAIRNLDYRSTFYIYDILDYATWSFALTSDATFAAGKKYYTEASGFYTQATVAEGASVPVPYYTHSYALTEDETFQEGKTYYTESGGVYSAATVTAGGAVTANTYYEDVYTMVQGVKFDSGTTYYTKSGTTYTPVNLIFVGENVPANSYYEHSYALTEDETFQEGKTYYTESNGEYSAATVTAGDAVTANTYYEDAYALTEDTTFGSGTTYYTVSGGTYTAALSVTTNDDVPTAYYNHSKLSFAGMTRNVTYRFDEIVDAPIEITLPTVPDDGYGAWFEIQMRFDNTYSITLLPTDNTVKIGTAQTQAQSAGINVVDLQYSDVDDVKMWTLLNTHSNIPTT